MTARIAYRVQEVAEQLGVADATVYRWVADGELRHVRINGVRLIRPADLEAFMDAHTEGSRAGGDQLAPRRARSTRGRAS